MIEGNMFLFSDTLNKDVQGNKTAIFVKTNNEENVKKFHEKLKDGATIHADLGPIFFSPMYSYLTDKYGISWQFVYIK